VIEAAQARCLARNYERTDDSDCLGCHGRQVRNFLHRQQPVQVSSRPADHNDEISPVRRSGAAQADDADSGSVQDPRYAPADAPVAIDPDDRSAPPAKRPGPAISIPMGNRRRRQLGGEPAPDRGG
jgi:hypothetical protein